MSLNTYTFLALLTFALGAGSYFLFRETMNKIQYLECLRLYWITKDNVDEYTPRLVKSFMRQDTAPFWYGRGLQVRFRRWTFQLGVLQGRADSLAAQLGRWMDLEPKQIRRWGVDDAPSSD